MGWWRTSDGDTIGDPPLNVLDRYADCGWRTSADLPPAVLAALTACYQDDLGRPPTDAELRAVLRFCFGKE